MLAGSASAAQKQRPSPSFSPSPPTPMSRFVHSPATGSLFVAGTNALLELDARSLRVLGRLETGPRLDSPSCHASGCSEGNNATRKLTDNVNKVLVLDQESQHLIACGSLFQGACQKISVHGHLQVSHFVLAEIMFHERPKKFLKI